MAWQEQFGQFCRVRWLGALALWLVLYVGCGNSDGGDSHRYTPTASATVTAKATPSATSTATATATKTFTRTPAPSATFSSTATPSATLTPQPSATLSATGTATPTATPVGSPHPTLPASRTGWYVGVAKRNITPQNPVFLGGYGLGPRRRSTGVLAPIYVRAMVLSNGENTLAFASNDTQGTFAAYKRGPFGFTETRIEIARATSGAIPLEHIILSSDHTHSGPDTTGVWGGLPNSYMNFLLEQTVGAVVDAWNALRPAELRIGSVDATELLRSQFDRPPNDRVDGELRVLAAYDVEEPQRMRALLVNFAAHATVMGPRNTLISGDWPGVVAELAEQEWELEGAVVMVADVGRTQPADRGDLDEVARLQDYAGRVAAKVRAAVANLVPVEGNSVVARQFFVREPYANPLVDFSLLSSLVSRSSRVPWLDGMEVGTVVSAARVGDVLFVALPGEGYPAIQFELQQRVVAQKHFVFGLANDQLGYLISPEEGYGQVRDAAPDNDNAIFNVSPAIGDHVLCVALDAAAEVGFRVTEPLEKCTRWAGEDRTIPALAKSTSW